jgi:hypothetical protein
MIGREAVHDFEQSDWFGLFIILSNWVWSALVLVFKLLHPAGEFCAFHTTIGISHYLKPLKFVLPSSKGRRCHQITLPSSKPRKTAVFYQKPPRFEALT